MFYDFKVNYIPQVWKPVAGAEDSGAGAGQNGGVGPDEPSDGLERAVQSVGSS